MRGEKHLVCGENGKTSRRATSGMTERQREKDYSCANARRNEQCGSLRRIDTPASVEVIDAMELIFANDNRLRVIKAFG
jgi:hypothetical protein